MPKARPFVFCWGGMFFLSPFNGIQFGGNSTFNLNNMNMGPSDPYTGAPISNGDCPAGTRAGYSPVSLPHDAVGAAQWYKESQAAATTVWVGLEYQPFRLALVCWPPFRLA